MMSEGLVEPDFRADRRRLFNFSIDELADFVAEHEHETFSHFAFDCTHDSGQILLCLDTPEQSRLAAIATEEYFRKDVRERLDEDDRYDVMGAVNTVARRMLPVLPFGDNTGDFAYQGFAGIRFDDWEEFALDDRYEAHSRATVEGFKIVPKDFDYLKSRVVMLLTHAIDELVEADAFSPLRKTSPFLLGFGLHDGPQVLTRIINW